MNTFAKNIKCARNIKFSKGEILKSLSHIICMFSRYTKERDHALIDIQKWIQLSLFVLSLIIKNLGTVKL